MDLVTVLALCALHQGMQSAASHPDPSTFAPTLATIQANTVPARFRLVVLPVADAPSPPPEIERWQPFMAEASRRFGIPEAWIRVVMQAESGGQAMRHGRPITSRAGAMGLMQIMPETYQEMTHRYGLGNDPSDPRDNILAGAAYLRQMLERFGYPQLFAAYNAGPEQFDAYLRDGVPLPVETWTYLAAIGPYLAEFVAAAGPPRPMTLAPNTVVRAGNPSGTALFFPVGIVSAAFVPQPHTTARDGGPEGDPGRTADPSGGLFVALGTGRLRPAITERWR
jgi:hypothetical protein